MSGRRKPGRFGTACAVVAALAVLANACADEQAAIPATEVDLETPVVELEGWEDLVDALDITHDRAESLSRLIDTFRIGLDISRSFPTEEERLESEEQWWQEMQRSLGAYSEAQRAQIFAWLEARFGRRRPS